MEPVIFLVDDDDGSRDAMTRTLERVGYSLHAFASAEEALEKLRDGEQVDAIVSDVRMPGMDGYEFLREVRAEYPNLPFLLVTAYADVKDAVAALQEGADDYLTKPVKVQELRQRVQLQLERRVLSDENRRLRQRLEKSFGFEGIVGHSTAMEDLLERLRVVAPTRSTVLIVGESGTGKELVANALHQNSPRARRAIRGHQLRRYSRRDPRVRALWSRKGGLHRRAPASDRSDRTGRRWDTVSRRNFGAVRRSSGQVASGARGASHHAGRWGDTDCGRFPARGGDQSSSRSSGSSRVVSVRISSIDSRWSSSAFRPLRERAGDIPLFVQHFLEHFNEELESNVSGVHPAVLATLKRQSWPGNVRELRNLIETMVLFARSGEIGLEDLPAEYRTPTQQTESLEPTAWQPRPMDEIEKEAILRTVAHTGGHRARAADLLEIGLRTLQRKLKEYGEIAPRENGESEGEE